MKAVYLCVALCLRGSCLGSSVCDNLSKSPPSEKSRVALEEIIRKVGFNPKLIWLHESSDIVVAEHGGAMSLKCSYGSGEEKWIIYDPKLIKDDSALKFAFAHEVAHQLNEDTDQTDEEKKKETPDDKKKKELDADYYGAQYLVRLNWTKEQVFQALDQLNLHPGKGYPTLEERKAKVALAFSDESKLSGTLNPPTGTAKGIHPEGPRLTNDLSGAFHLRPTANWDYGADIIGRYHVARGRINLVFESETVYGITGNYTVSSFVYGVCYATGVNGEWEMSEGESAAQVSFRKKISLGPGTRTGFSTMTQVNFQAPKITSSKAPWLCATLNQPDGHYVPLHDESVINLPVP